MSEGVVVKGVVVKGSTIGSLFYFRLIATII